MNADLLRPQPVGLAPWPLGGLLLPSRPGAEDFAARLLAGQEPEAIPEAFRFWRHAEQEEWDLAWECLAHEEDAVSAYDRFVLRPDAGTLEELRARFEGPLAALLEVAAHHAGFEAQLEVIDSLDAELLGLACGVAAAARIESGDPEGALDFLDRGIEAAAPISPGLTIELMLSRVELRGMDDEDPDRAIRELEDARSLLPEGGFVSLRAELDLEIGGLLQESAGADHRRVQKAVGCFQSALHGLDRERHPRAHGFAQMRLGLAFLSLPMQSAGDALRMGVATQALREAVSVLSLRREPELWCVAATNLANAYQILPSGHLEQNIEEAVGLYGEVLGFRETVEDPSAVARTLANRANALASLERYREATDDLIRAVPLFHRCGLEAEEQQTQAMLDDLRRRAAGVNEENAS